MYKKIIPRSDLIEKIYSGTELIASVVKTTLGPGGRPVIIQRLGQQLNGDPLGPRITKDGVSVAEECGSDDPVENEIINSIKDICKKTNSKVGDGTTTAIVLGEKILSEALSYATKKDINIQQVRESIEEATQRVLSYLEEEAVNITDPEQIKYVATISANGDEEIGDAIKRAILEVGEEGVITVDEGVTNGISLEVVEGYQIKQGAEGREIFFNNKENTMFIGEDVHVVIYDGNLYNYNDLIRPLEKIKESNNGSFPPVLFIANEFSTEVIQFLKVQRNQVSLQFCAVKGPHVTHVRSSYYDDIATMLGGTRLGNGNRNLAACEVDDIGIARKVTVDKYSTTFFEGQGLEEDILERVEQLKASKDHAESPYDAQVISERIAALTQGVAKIGVGAPTEVDIKEKYDRVEDALNAARAAITGGLIPGGGTTLLRISQKIKGDTIGEKILKEAIKEPFYAILKNIGLDKVSKVEERLLKEKEAVYDARNKEFVNYLDSGIIDPVNVTKSALENAVSIASLLSTTGGAVIFKKE